MTDLSLLSATDLTQQYATRTLTPVEVVDEVIHRIESENPTLNALCWQDSAKARADAEASAARWKAGAPLSPIDGVPTTIKDIILTAGAPTLRGSRTVQTDQNWDENAPVAARLLRAGAIVVGKTTSPEFGWKGVTDCPLTGITRNPWAPDRTPGGSSGGASAAAASGMGALHIGTDGGGSIRIPAGFTGIFGLKPSFGRVPAYPASPFGTLSHIGPMTRTVRDAARMLTIMSEGFSPEDSGDWYALPRTRLDWETGLEDGVAGLKIAYSPTLGFDGVFVDPQIAAQVARAANVYADLGAEVQEISLDHPDPRDTFVTLWSAGAANLLKDASEDDLEKLDPGLRALCERGRVHSMQDYLDAVSQREAFGQHMRRFHATWDLVLCPCMPIPAFEAGSEVPSRQTHEHSFRHWWDWTPFTYPFNLSQQPAAAVPFGTIMDDGVQLPTGFQLVGRMHDEATVLRAARAFEAKHPFALPA